MQKVLRISVIMMAGLAVFLSISTLHASRDVKQEGFRYERVRSPFDNKVYAIKIPEYMEFAGEKVPLDDQEVRERFDRELLVNTYWHSQTIYIMKEMPQVISMVKPILAKHGIPEDFIYLCIAESGLQVTAQSPSGAAGLWQFMKATGQHYGLLINGEVDERYHFEKSTEAACRYFLEARERFGSWTTAAASFNRGMEGMEAAIKNQKTSNYYELYLNQETYRYIFRVLALKQILANPQEYGFFLESDDLFPPYKYQTVKVHSAIPDLADFARSYGTNYKTLRMLNPWIMGYSISNKENLEYEFKVPAAD